MKTVGCTERLLDNLGDGSGMCAVKAEALRKLTGATRPIGFEAAGRLRRTSRAPPELRLCTAPFLVCEFNFKLPR